MGCMCWQGQVATIQHLTSPIQLCIVGQRPNTGCGQVFKLLLTTTHGTPLSHCLHLCYGSRTRPAQHRNSADSIQRPKAVRLHHIYSETQTEMPAQGHGTRHSFLPM